MNAPRHLTLRERIYEEIVRMIVSGELPSGTALDEKVLTEKLQVSRTPFREALGTLAKEGLIEIVASNERALLRSLDGFHVKGAKGQRLETSGLKINDRLVVSGFETLRNKSKVSIIQ